MEAGVQVCVFVWGMEETVKSEVFMQNLDSVSQIRSCYNNIL